MKNAQTTCTSAHAQNVCKVKKGVNCKMTELTKYTLVDVLVDRHSDRRSNKPILIVSFYYNVESQANQGLRSHYNAII